MLVLAVDWMAHEGHEDEVAEVFTKLQAASRQEPACLMYTVHRHKTNPRHFFIYEQYTDEAGLKAHHDSSHFKEYAIQALQDIGERKAGEFYTPLTDD